MEKSNAAVRFQALDDEDLEAVTGGAGGFKAGFEKGLGDNPVGSIPEGLQWTPEKFWDAPLGRAVDFVGQAVGAWGPSTSDTTGLAPGMDGMADHLQSEHDTSPAGHSEGIDAMADHLQTEHDLSPASPSDDAAPADDPGGYHETGFGDDDVHVADADTDTDTSMGGFDDDGSHDTDADGGGFGGDGDGGDGGDD